jgi:mannose-1-phosphate guanylyltransferase
MGPKSGLSPVLWFMPADHFIKDEAILREAIETAYEAAQAGYIVTLGIQPVSPETGYGYIRKGEKIMETGVYSVKKFTEKPDRQTAQGFLDEGGYFWNSGMVIAQSQTVIDEFEIHAPHILNAVRAAMQITGLDAGIYSKIEKQPFDKAVLEKSAKLAVVTCDPGWDDIGTPESLARIQKKFKA